MNTSFFKNSASFAIACLALCLFVSSCQRDRKVLLPVQTSEGGAWIFINDKGERVGNQEWEFEPSISQDGIFTANTEDGLTVYRWDGEEAKPIDSLTNLVSVGVLSDGLMPVTPRMERIRVVNGKGKVKFMIQPIDGKEVTSCASKFSEGLLVVNTSEGKAGVINKKGEIVVAPKYSEISNFNEGFALAADYNYDDPDAGPSYYILDKDGNEKAVKGEFGYWEGDCSFVPEFEDGVAVVPGKGDLVDDMYEFKNVMIHTDGKVSDLEAQDWVATLPFGGMIESKYDEDKNTYIWTDKEGKVVKKIEDGGWLSVYGNFVVLQESDSMTVYASDGSELAKIEGNVFPMWSDGNFGLVYGERTDDYSDPTVYRIMDPEGNVMEGRYYGVGTSETISLRQGYEDDVMCDEGAVTSAYVDITAAASRLASMISNGVKGKSLYYLGESVAEILSGENAGFYTGSGRDFNLPTDSTYYIASGAGFWISGSGRASADIVAPTYQKYFEVHHYDYYGNAWGWNRTRQVGVHFNNSAKVIAFDLTLHTNHPSGEQLREALGRRLKNEGFTLTQDEPNYSEYTNGYRNVIIYGTKDSAGIGAIVYNKDSNFHKSDEDKASLAAQLTY